MIVIYENYQLINTYIIHVIKKRKKKKKNRCVYVPYARV